MRKLSAEQAAGIRERSHAQARKRVATEVGELLLAREATEEEFASVEEFDVFAQQVKDSEAARERDWVVCYMTHYYRAFAYYTAFELSGADADFARQCARDPDIAAEIAARATLSAEQVNGDEPRR